MIRAILFDLDGVLVESYEVWFHLMNGAALDLGYPGIDRKTFHESWGQGVQADVDRFFPRHTVPQIERYFVEHFRDHAEHMTVNAEGPHVFKALRDRGTGIAVITNTPSPLAREVLAATRLEPDVLVGGTDVPRAKPAPDMVLRACELLEAPASEALVVGDSRFDREAAAAAGVRFAGYRTDGDETLENLTAVLGLNGRRS